MSNFFDDNDDFFSENKSKKKSDDFDFSDDDKNDPFNFGDKGSQWGKPVSEKMSWLENLPKLPKWGWIAAGTAATLVVGGISLGPLGGYSEIRKATSEAYRLGFEHGENLFGGRDLPSFEVFESYYPDEFSNVTTDTPEQLAAVEKYCEAAWGIEGLLNGLINSSSNKSDFVDGCLDGYRTIGK